ncbi:MAG: histidinol-phosphate transaminase, partial [Burkholderiales bacterium]|nr:histidinol-phosphate transaminase [Burkholderiales bacterium]
MTTIDALLQNVIRPDVLALSAYHVPDASGMLKLDAMENPYHLPPPLKQQLAARLAEVALNRYPVPTYSVLKEKICQRLGVPDGYQVVLGNGSDELIGMLAIACAKQERRASVLAPTPGFVMYAMSSQLAGLDFIGVPLKEDFTLDLPAMLAAIEQHQPAITYLAYPNNPTGNLFDSNAVEAIVRASHGVVVVDEAYQPFADASFMPRLPEFENLIVMRTVSKLGLAGIRLGYMSGHPKLLAELEKVRPPYNVNVLTEAAAEFALDHLTVFDAQAMAVRTEREMLAARLASLPNVEVFPSSANFLLVRL